MQRVSAPPKRSGPRLRPRSARTAGSARASPSSFSFTTITFFSSQLVRLLELEDRQRHLIDALALADVVERGGGALPPRQVRPFVGDLLQEIGRGRADLLDHEIQRAVGLLGLAQHRVDVRQQHRIAAEAGVERDRLAVVAQRLLVCRSSAKATRPSM